MLTDDQLRRIMPNASTGRRNAALPVLNSAAVAYEINNERRMAAWLATIAVESGELKYQEEIASGAAYEGRKDLGNTQKGDGRRFKGHGRIQITGRDNTQRYTNYLKKSGHLPFVNFIAEPERLAQEPYATDSAGWFWAIYKKLNGPADRGEFLTTQIKVNGRNKKTGLPNHWSIRNNYFIKALSVLPDGFTFSATTPADSNVVKPVDNTENKTEPADTSLPSDVPQSPANKTDIVIEKEPEVTETKPKGVFGALWQKVTGALGGGVTADVAIEKAQQAQALGLSERTWTFIFWAIIAGLAIWIVYHFVVVKILPWGKWLVGRIRTNQLVAGNATADTVQVISSDKLAEYEAAGYTVIRRS